MRKTQEQSRCLLDIFIPIKGKTGSSHKPKVKFMSDFLEYKMNDNDNQFRTKTFDINLRLEIEFHFAEIAGADIDNLLKSLFDSLQQSKVIKNDKSIKEIHVTLKEFSLFEGIAIKFFKNKNF